MAVFASIAVSFGCSISLLCFTAVPSAAAPSRIVRLQDQEDLSDFPFEFSTTRGSKVTADNVLVQSVSEGGDTVFETNKPQPIKRYQSTAPLRDDDADDDDYGANDNGGKNKRPGPLQSAASKPTKMFSFNGKPVSMGNNGQYVTTYYHYPARRESASEVAANDVVVPSSSLAVPSVGGQWEVLQNLYKYIYPGISGMKIAYISN